jgi:ribosomal protein S18 acetylase RimI-like enzyme
MADDTYDPFNLRKHPGYYAELVQERDPTQDVAASYVKNHQYDGGILGQLERNPHGLGDSPLPFDPSGAELRSTSEGGSAFTERPKDHLQPVAELISPTLGAFGAGQMAGTAYKEAGEGDYQEAGMSLAPLLAGMVVPGAPKGVRGPKAITREIDARGFYSPSLEAVKGLGQETGTVQQFRSMLLKAGGKPKELEAVGFDRAFPNPNAKVSRSDIEQYLRDNRVQLGQVRKGEPLDTEAFNAMSYEDAKNYAEPQQTKFESYSTPGGIPGSYREVVTTLPQETKTLDQIAREKGHKGWSFDLTPAQREEILAAQTPELSPTNVYTSSHWPGITNPVLHYRQKDFLNHADPTSVGALEKVTRASQLGIRFEDAGNGTFVARKDGKEVGRANLKEDGDYLTSISVAPEFQRQGIGQELADFVEAQSGQSLRPSPTYQTPAGEAFWRARNSRSPSPQSGSGEGTTSGGAFRSPESNLPSKTRVLDEMQSDWAQRARDQGTRDPVKLAELQREQERITAQLAALSDRGELLAREAKVPTHMEDASTQERLDWAVKKDPALAEKVRALRAEWDSAYNASLDVANKMVANQKGVPDHPLIRTTDEWTRLGLSQVLIDAARDPSVNRLAWAPGKVQADRYGLQKDVSQVQLVNPVWDETGSKITRGDLVVTGKNGNDLLSERGVSGDRVRELLGNEFSERLFNAPPRNTGGMQVHELTGDGLQMGGEGMKSFYGDMTPEGYQSGIVGTRLQKLVKGLDPEAARVEPHKIGEHYPKLTPGQGYLPEDINYPSMSITPAMREKILKEGLPLFNVAALSALVQRILGQGQPDTEGEDGGGF